MKSAFILAALLVCVFPAVTLGIVDFFSVQDEIVAVPTENTQQEQKTVSVLSEDGVITMELEEYICCVVLAEMPADFEMEALKAQSVVARTYTCRRLNNPKHDSANVCTEPSCCQAYLSCESFLENGGTQQSVEKVQAAVLDTAGQALFYGGDFIEATYFSCSGGKTEDALAVWGSDVPYLQSVSSPGEEKATHYTDTVTFSVAEFCEKLNIHSDDLYHFGIESITYTEGGGVATIDIGGKTYTGTSVRQKLGLRSTAFVMTWAGETVTVTTKGFGHRVGMSQYGAEAMAAQGADYVSILEHYYQGATLSDAFG